jgi:serine O-acetyltransferase
MFFWPRIEKSSLTVLFGMTSEEKMAAPPPGWARNPFLVRALLFCCRKRFYYGQRLLGILLGCDIACRISDNFRMPHPYGIVIHSGAVIGKNAVIMHQVTVGALDLGNQAPVVGDDVYIGAGAKILGGIRIGDRCVIGANAVVTKDMPAGSTVVGANRIIKRTLAARQNPVAET